MNDSWSQSTFSWQSTKLPKSLEMQTWQLTVTATESVLHHSLHNERKQWRQFREIRGSRCMTTGRIRSRFNAVFWRRQRTHTGHTFGHRHISWFDAADIRVTSSCGRRVGYGWWCRKYWSVEVWWRRGDTARLGHVWSSGWRQQTSWRWFAATDEVLQLVDTGVLVVVNPPGQIEQFLMLLLLRKQEAQLSPRDRASGAHYTGG